MSANEVTTSSPSLASPNVALVGFKWMELLEKEFDKSFVALDEELRNFSDDYEAPEMYDANRKMLTNLGSCFVQAVHKAQTIFQVCILWNISTLSFPSVQSITTRKNG